MVTCCPGCAGHLLPGLRWSLVAQAALVTCCPGYVGDLLPGPRWPPVARGVGNLLPGLRWRFAALTALVTGCLGCVGDLLPGLRWSPVALDVLGWANLLDEYKPFRGAKQRSQPPPTRQESWAGPILLTSMSPSLRAWSCSAISHCLDRACARAMALGLAVRRQRAEAVCHDAAAIVH